MGVVFLGVPVSDVLLKWSSFEAPTGHVVPTSHLKVRQVTIRLPAQATGE